MAISASYSGVSQDLTVIGDAGANAIAISRNAAGKLFVNNGSVAIAGGPATVANTDLIVISGDLGNDTISLDETNGALPAAELAGGVGNDSLTSGSGADLLQGEAGDDTLLGRAGGDVLYGGDDDDTLVGGSGDDQVFGGLGTDRMVWNSGDGSDLFEGGDGIDTAEVNGGNGGEQFTITANGARVRFDRIDPAPFALDIGTTETLVLNANGGDDTIGTSGNLAALISLNIDGGAGNDTILGGNGADTLIGGDGDDFIDGNQGNDTAFLGAGADVFNWDPGDGSDTIEGQAGSDTLNFNGSAANEKYELLPNGPRALLTRDVGAITMDMNGIEQVTLNIASGIDFVTLHAMDGTNVTGVTVNLAATIGGSVADGAVDTVTLNGSGENDTITLTGSTGVVTVAGLLPAITLNQIEAIDAISVVAGDGNDKVSAATVATSIAKVQLDGGAGNDTLTSAGDGVYLGGTGNDTIRAGLTNSSEVLDGGDGVDKVDTTTWGGTYIIDMVTGDTNYFGESFTNFENVVTGAGQDTITGTDGNNSISTNDNNDTLDGAGGNDTLDGGAGIDTMTGGIGNDVYYVDDAADVVIEGAGQGNDRVLASASYTLAAGAEVEKLATTNSAGSTPIDLTGNAYSQSIVGNAGSNVLIGGDGKDDLTGGRGKDTLDGGKKPDKFIYTAASDSTSLSYDIVVKCDFSKDRFDTTAAVSAIDATISGGTLRSGHFNHDLAAAADAGALGAGHAVLFTPNGGNLSGKTFLVVDQNGVAGYQAGRDLVMELKNAVHLANIDAGDFI